MEHLRKSALGGAALIAAVVWGPRAWAESGPSDGNPSPNVEKAAAPEQPTTLARDDSVKAATSAPQDQPEKPQAPPTEPEGSGPDASAEIDRARSGIPRRRDAAQEAYRKAREKFMARIQDGNLEDLSAEEKKGLEVAQKSLEKARARLQAAHTKKPAERMPTKLRASLEKRLLTLHAERVRSRTERTQEQREKLKEHFHNVTPDAKAVAELRQHAWRVARLLRLKELAEAGDRAELLTRIEELMEKENARHEKLLAELKINRVATKRTSDAPGKTMKAPASAAIEPAQKKDGAE